MQTFEKNMYTSMSNMPENNYFTTFTNTKKTVENIFLFSLKMCRAKKKIEFQLALKTSIS